MKMKCMPDQKLRPQHKIQRKLFEEVYVNLYRVFGFSGDQIHKQWLLICSLSVFLLLLLKPLFILSASFLFYRKVLLCVEVFCVGNELVVIIVLLFWCIVCYCNSLSWNECNHIRNRSLLPEKAKIPSYCLISIRNRDDRDHNGYM